MPTPVQTVAKCYHCGNECTTGQVQIAEKNFCCTGCQTVYEPLEANALCNYYALQPHAGNAPAQGQFAFLDNPDIQAQLIDFKNDTLEKITFYIPDIHCSSCFYTQAKLVLEFLDKSNSLNLCPINCFNWSLCWSIFSKNVSIASENSLNFS